MKPIAPRPPGARHDWEPDVPPAGGAEDEFSPSAREAPWHNFHGRFNCFTRPTQGGPLG